MKKQLLLLFFASFFAITTFAQADQILGVWLSEEGTSHIEIAKDSNGEFVGKIVWLKEPLDENGRPKVDGENPNANLRNRPIINLQILEGFSYNERRKEWSGGTIYDPQNGRRYRAVMKLENNNTMALRGFVGLRAFGRTSTWTRVK